MKRIIKKTPFIYKFLRKIWWHFTGISVNKIDKLFLHTNTAPVTTGSLVSILCNTWNTPPEFLVKMLNSIKQQTWQNWELLINNCSDSAHPAVEKILLEAAKKDSRIKIFKTENQGIALNTNFIASKASGEWLLLMDHDDLLHPDCISLLMAKGVKLEADFVFSDEYMLLMCYKRMRRTTKKNFSLKDLERFNFINHPALFRKNLYERTGGLRPNFEGSQDFDFYLRCTEVTNKFAYVPKALYIWRVNQGSFSETHLDVCMQSGKRALEEHFRRIGSPCEVKIAEDGISFVVTNQK